ncbi:unnamed protein product [Moneuplotes crassus]|uniref:Transmembrane protein n=1 Tax=Euplotes crassus TaxID=5936 RepID=A0AAD1XZ06_EUPCR|nr:unnamed protein product [Moneuplotes crassus]
MEDKKKEPKISPHNPFKDEIEQQKGKKLSLSNPITKQESSICCRFPLSKADRLRYFKRILHYYGYKLITAEEKKKRQRIWNVEAIGLSAWGGSLGYSYYYSKSRSFFYSLFYQNKLLGNAYLFFPVFLTIGVMYQARKYDFYLLDKYCGEKSDEELAQMEMDLNPNIAKVYGENLTRLQMKERK